MEKPLAEILPLKTKLGFGVGDIYGGGALVIIGFYYLHFLTDVLLITPYLAGIAFLISKTWDAITDPLMGVISRSHEIQIWAAASILISRRNSRIFLLCHALVSGQF